MNHLNGNGAPPAGKSISEILDELDEKPHHKNGNGIVVPEGFVSGDQAEAMVVAAQAETVERTSAFFLEQLMNATSVLSGDIRAVGQAIDDAITHFLVQLRQQHGPEYSQMIAGILIANIALFLDKNMKAAVRDLVSQVGGPDGSPMQGRPAAA